MNIFHLDKDIRTCAMYHCDKHVVKMVTEYAQILSTAQVLMDDNPTGVMQKSYVNHPCTVWARATSSNYRLLFSLYNELAKEYRYRYGKIHMAWSRYVIGLMNTPTGIPKGPCTPLPLAMPDYCKVGDSIESYRYYYVHEKKHLHTWKGRTTPPFIAD